MIIPPTRTTQLTGSDGTPQNRFASYLEDITSQVNDLKTAVSTLTGNTGVYNTTNVTTDREFDANTVTLAELADVVGTLIADLKAAGTVK